MAAGDENAAVLNKFFFTRYSYTGFTGKGKRVIENKHS